MTFWSGSAATANLLRHSTDENSVTRLAFAAVTPITVAPNAANLSVASAKSCASCVQPGVKAAGKKYRTTGPFFRASASEKVNSLPPSAAWVVKSGAFAPTDKAAYAAPANADAANPIAKAKLLRISVSLRYSKSGP